VTQRARVCSKYKYWAQCLYAEIKPKCSKAAAEYFITYLLNGWQPYLYSRYRCHLGTLILLSYSEFSAVANNELKHESRAVARKPPNFKSQASELQIYRRKTEFNAKWRFKVIIITCFGVNGKDKALNNTIQEAQLPLRNRASALYFFAAKLLSIA